MVKAGGGRGVPACAQRLRVLLSRRLGLRHQCVQDSGFSHCALAQQQVAAVFQVRQQGLARGGCVGRADFQDGHAQPGEGLEPRSRFPHRWQVGLVQDNHGRYVGAPGSHQGAARKLIREHGLRRHHNEQLIDVGCELLGVLLVRPIQQVLARKNSFDTAFFSLQGECHKVADCRTSLLAAGITLTQAAVVEFYHVVPPVRRHDAPLTAGSIVCSRASGLS